MNRAKVLMFAALVMACTGFFATLSQPVLAANDDLLRHVSDLGIPLGR